MTDDIQKTLDGIRRRVEQLPDEHAMRAPCAKCGCAVGRIYAKGSQDCVYCLECGAFQYNAPRTETGKEVRTLQTIRGIPPSQRSRILERAHGRCELCGSRNDLTIAHILSVKDGFDFLTDVHLNSDDNLMALCAECNSGQGHHSMPPWLVAALLYQRNRG
jgi:5-methylcytosine-specific restriction endonuclease McrA